MMGEPKAFASLSAGLLARKGGARPAMRRQPLGGMISTSAGMGANAHAAVQDDLGWNDMGYDPDPDRNAQDPSLDMKIWLPGSVMVPSEHAISENDLRGAQPVPEVVRQQEALRDRLGQEMVQDDSPAPLVEAEQPVVVAEKSKAMRPSRRKTAAKVAVPVAVPVAVEAAVSNAKSTVRARDKAAFTLRLDADQHLRLRLASAVSNLSSQNILIGLLDEYLASLPEIGDLAARVPAAPPARIARAR